jgi:hypothetical protein
VGAPSRAIARAGLHAHSKTDQPDICKRFSEFLSRNNAVFFKPVLHIGFYVAVQIIFPG